MPFPEKLRLLMRRHGLTQASLGSHLGVSHRAVGKWLAGDSTPGADVARRLADFLRVPIDDLLDADRDLPPDPVAEEMQARYAEAVAVADSMPPEARQATFQAMIERGQHRLAMQEMAKRLRALADEMDPPAKRDVDIDAIEGDLNRVQGQIKHQDGPGQKRRPA